jgi:hypothetical protein
MQVKWPAIVGLALAVALGALAVWRNFPYPGAARIEVYLPCPDPVAGCTALVGNRTVSIGMAGERKPLTAFQVWVKAAGAVTAQASFTMVGMNMGLNRYTLRPDVAGVFHAEVILPVCVSGRREWVMSLDIDDTIRVSMPFTTGSP